jgi:hypothetical protein
VTLGDVPLARLSTEEIAKQPEGWAVLDEGFVTVKVPDRFEPVRITIEGG